MSTNPQCCTSKLTLSCTASGGEAGSTITGGPNPSTGWSRQLTITRARQSPSQARIESAAWPIVSSRDVTTAVTKNKESPGSTDCANVAGPPVFLQRNGHAPRPAESTGSVHAPRPQAARAHVAPAAVRLRILASYRHSWLPSPWQLAPSRRMVTGTTGNRFPIRKVISAVQPNGSALKLPATSGQQHR